LTGPRRPSLERLLDDALALADLAEADEEAVERVAARADRDVEVDLVVLEVRVRLADVVGDPVARRHGPVHAEGDRVGPLMAPTPSRRSRKMRFLRSIFSPSSTMRGSAATARGTAP
jgi:hypothetical protein